MTSPTPKTRAYKYKQASAHNFIHYLNHSIKFFKRNSQHTTSQDVKEDHVEEL